MKIKTATLTGPALDWAVEYARLSKVEPDSMRVSIASRNQRFWATGASISWAVGGPIIGREQILFAGTEGSYHAWLSNRTKLDTTYSSPTHLIAAMRCYVASVLGVEVEIPDGIL